MAGSDEAMSDALSDDGKNHAKATFNDADSAGTNTTKLDWEQAKVKTGTSAQAQNQDEEDAGLVEEDPLPPYLNPAGIYTSLLYQKGKREQASAPFVSLPPRTIGGMQDQISPTITCACKSSKCIRLYCDCFASNLLCTGKCTCSDGCYNNGAPENTPTRTGAILTVLNAQPFAFRPSPQQLQLASAGAINEFMSKQTAPSSNCSCRKSRCLKAYCECWNAGTYCQDDKCSCKSTCSNRPGIEEREVLMARRNGFNAEAAKTTTQSGPTTGVSQSASGVPTMAGSQSSSPKNNQVNIHSNKSVKIIARVPGSTQNANSSLKAIPLPPSAFATPVQVEGKLVQGLSFGRALPSQGEGSNGNTDSPSKRRLYHNLMLSPSKLGAKHDVAKKRKMKEGTELEADWYEDTGEVREFFRIMRKQIDSRKVGDGDEFSEEEATETRVRSVLEVVEDDIKNAEKVVEAAELDILTRLHEQKRKPSQSNLEPMEDDDSADDDVAELKCDETLMLSEETRPMDPALKELTILAAQETALIREAARVIRRKARELCERRILNEEERA